MIFFHLKQKENCCKEVVFQSFSDVQLAEKKQTAIESRDLRPKNVERLKESINDYDWQGLLSNVIP